MAAPRIIDRMLLRSRLSRALARRGEPGGFLMERVVAELADRLTLVERRFERALALEDGTGRLSAALAEHARVGSVLRLAPVEPSGPGDTGRTAKYLSVVVDAEALPIAAASLDLVASALSLQFANDLPGVLVQIRRALRPDGLLLGAMLGGETLGELRHVLAAAETEIHGGASPRVLPFADLRDIGALLQRAGFALPVTDRDTLTVRYGNPVALFADLRAMGAANPLAERSRLPGSRRLFARTAELYRELFADPDGRVRATFEVVWFSGWAPHESQQQPARRGSATVSLADVLGTGKGKD